MEVAIFCKVIDNFGDAGFCLRLARGLSTKVKRIKLYCDDITLMKKMCFVDGNDNQLMTKNLVICDYGDHVASEKISSIYLVIEAFQAEPPINFLKKIHLLSGVTRVVLDYLVTENSVDSFLNQIAPDYKLLKFFPNHDWNSSSSAKRIWLAPGFSSGSAGLISNGWKKLNTSLRKKIRDTILSSPYTKLKKNKSGDLGSVFIVCVFLYEVHNIFVDCPVPDGFDSLAIWQPKSIVMNQIDFDCALQSCDFNYIRGQDSFLSAHNAAASQWKVPFVWQPYIETNEGHIKKFEGWRKNFPDNEFHSYWEFARSVAARNNKDFADKWEKFIFEWDLFKNFFHARCLNITKRKSLEQSLLNCVEANC